ncbi:IstB-like ATP binding protein [Alicyclobacillus macrosporangiidus]|uniref:IstB-like ATP binding protein n=1 Tax=Alicyclobacillus macrosporangiidus TaxID=392015 RepID=A0A1I7LGB4_9BACL|nr:IstB-like ATP binding protein [Alicyclobacillus macrosporangiidus]
MNVYFVTMQRLVANLRRAYQEGRPDKRLRIYTQPKLLICDEVGYLPLDGRRELLPDRVGTLRTRGADHHVQHQLYQLGNTLR